MRRKRRVWADRIDWQNKAKVNSWLLHGFIVKNREDWDALTHEGSVRTWVCSVQNLPPQPDGPNLMVCKHTILPASDLSCIEDMELSYHLFWIHLKKSCWIFTTLLLDRRPHCIVSSFSLHPTLQNMVQFYYVFIYNEFHPFAARLLRGRFNCWTIYTAI